MSSPFGGRTIVDGGNEKGGTASFPIRYGSNSIFPPMGAGASSFFEDGKEVAGVIFFPVPSGITGTTAREQWSAGLRLN